MNVLCIIGAIIGVFSLFLPWVWVGEGDWRDSSSVYDMLLGPNDKTTSQWRSIGHWALIIVVSGTILAFAFPAACGIQGAGLAMYCYDFLGQDPLFGYDRGLSIGFFAAVVSTAVVAASLIAPLGIGFDELRGWWSRRAETASRLQRRNGQRTMQSFATPLEALRALRRDAKWTVALLATVLLLAILQYSSPVIYGLSEGSVDLVGESVVISVEGSATAVLWARTELRMSDDHNTVEWALESDDLDWYFSGDDWTPPVLEAKNLSELSVVPEITDYGGEGVVTHGDSITLTPINGTSFAEGVEYSVVVSEIRYVMDVGYRNLYVHFELVDGDVLYDLEVKESQGFSMPITIPFWFVYGVIFAIVVVSMVAYNVILRGVRRTKGEHPTIADDSAN